MRRRECYWPLLLGPVVIAASVSAGCGPAGNSGDSPRPRLERRPDGSIKGNVPDGYEVRALTPEEIRERYKNDPREVAAADEAASYPASLWRGGRSQASQMDDTPSAVFSLAADDVLEAYATAPVHPTLRVQCYERKISAYIETGSSMQPELGLYEQATVRLRWDQEKPVSQRWLESTDSKSIFSPSGVAFARRLVKAQRLRVELTPYNTSTRVVTFTVAGFGEERLRTLQEACR